MLWAASSGGPQETTRGTSSWPDPSYDFFRLPFYYLRSNIASVTHSHPVEARGMAKHSEPSPRLSAGEMEILEMLWRDGPVSLSEAQSGLGRKIGYTTIQTRLNRLVEKKLVTRSAERPAHYAAAVQPEAVSAGHLALLVKRTSGGSVVPLVAHLVRDWKLSADGNRRAQAIDRRSGTPIRNPVANEVPR